MSAAMVLSIRHSSLRSSSIMSFSNKLGASLTGLLLLLASKGLANDLTLAERFTVSEGRKAKGSPDEPADLTRLSVALRKPWSLSTIVIRGIVVSTLIAPSTPKSFNWLHSLRRFLQSFAVCP